MRDAQVGLVVTLLFSSVIKWLLIPIDCLIKDSEQSLSSVIHGVGAKCEPWQFPEILITVPTLLLIGTCVNVRMVHLPLLPCRCAAHKHTHSLNRNTHTHRIICGVCMCNELLCVRHQSARSRSARSGVCVCVCACACNFIYTDLSQHTDTRRRKRLRTCASGYCNVFA